LAYSILHVFASKYQKMLRVPSNNAIVMSLSVTEATPFFVNSCMRNAFLGKARLN